MSRFLTLCLLLCTGVPILVQGQDLQFEHITKSEGLTSDWNLFVENHPTQGAAFVVTHPKD